MDRLQVAIVVALMMKDLDRPRSLHKHKCQNCKFIFEHMTPPLEATEEEYHKAHDCPQCGNNERDIYEE